MAKPLVRVVDDDPAVLSSLQCVLEAAGWRCAAYDSAEAFLAGDAYSEPGCAVLDMRMGGMSGLELLAEMNRRGIRIPVIFYSGHADIVIAVSAMRKGAVNFLQKTAGPKDIVNAVSEVMERYGEEADIAPGLTPAQKVARFEALTDQEKRIARLVAEGELNSDIARALGIATKTLRNYKLQIRQKLGLEAPADLARFVRQVERIRNGEA